MPTTVVKGNWDSTLPSGSVYIGRPSKWGNPFSIGKHGSRNEVIKKYRQYIQTRQDLLDSLWELEDKELVCWCAPLACHGDVLKELIETKNPTSDGGVNIQGKG